MTVSVWSKIKPAHHNLVILATLIADSDNHVVDPYDSAEIVDMTENKLKKQTGLFCDLLSTWLLISAVM